MDPADSLGTMPPHQFAFGHFSASLNLFARGSRITRQTQRQTFLLRREEKKKYRARASGRRHHRRWGVRARGTER